MRSRGVGRNSEPPDRWGCYPDVVLVMLVPQPRTVGIADPTHTHYMEQAYEREPRVRLDRWVALEQTRFWWDTRFRFHALGVLLRHPPPPVPAPLLLYFCSVHRIGSMRYDRMHTFIRTPASLSDEQHLPQFNSY